MPSGHVLSVNVGRSARTEHSTPGVTGIDKRPVDVLRVSDPGPKSAGAGSGVAGDFIGDTKHHGGSTQAVYLFAREELDHWARELGRALAPGSFGENVTTSGVDVDGFAVGTVLAVGDQDRGGARLRVCGPRVPCRTFASHLGERRWVKRFADHGRSGAYCEVEQPGEIRPGDPVTVLQAPGHDIGLTTVLRALMGSRDDAAAVLEAAVLDPVHHEELAARMARRS